MKPIPIVLLIALVLGPTIVAQSDAPPIPTYVPSNRQILITEANRAHADPYELLAVARCESGMDSHATNGISFGILQFTKGTFALYAKKLNVANPDIWNVQQQAYIASWMFFHNEKSQWVCWGIVRGKIKVNH